MARRACAVCRTGTRPSGALDEAIRIGREAPIQVEVLHLKRSSIRLDAADEQGTIREADANVYPYAASSTTLSARVPDWVLEGGTERLRNPETRTRIRAERGVLMSRGVAGVTPETILLSRTPIAAQPGLSAPDAEGQQRVARLLADPGAAADGDVDRNTACPIRS